MSRAECQAMTAMGRVQPMLDGRDMKHVTSPPDADAFRAAGVGSLFVEFDVDNTQMFPGGREGWFILYGPNSIHGRNAVRMGMLVAELSVARNVVIKEAKQS